MSDTGIVEPPEAPAPAPPPAPARTRFGRIVLWVALVVVAAMAATMALAVMLVLFARSAEEPSQTGGVEVGAATSLASSESADLVSPGPTGGATSTPVLPTARTDGEAEELLLTFAEAWRTADWDRLEALASGSVIATAKEWYSEGGAPNISEDNLEFIFETCSVDGDGATSCMFTYDPSEGFGLIFTATYADNGSGLRVSELTIGGDAG